MAHKMQVDQNIYNSLKNMVSHISGKPEYELECKFQENLDKESFTRMLKYCRSIGMNETLHEDQLDIFCQKNIRISLKGKHAISEYCKSNVLDIANTHLEMISKQKVKDMQNINVKELKFRVDLRHEKPVDDITKLEILTKLPTSLKGFRYKKRFSYNDKNVRYDFTIVKTSFGEVFLSHKDFVTSDTLRSSDKYELEIEYKPSSGVQEKVKKGRNISKGATEIQPTDAVESLLSAMVTMYLIYYRETSYISQEDKSQAYKNYVHLCFGSSAKFDDVKNNPRTYFAAPQPVTLEMKNIIPPDLGVVSIRTEYSVTEKADGERMLFYVNSDGNCFLINSRLDFRFIGVKLNNLVNTIIDGEYISQDVLGKKISMFGAFDVYYYNSNDVKMKPLVVKKLKGAKASASKDRLSDLKDFEKKYGKKIIDDSGITFFVKEFLWEGDIFENAKTLLDKHASYPYKIDGLIFTPTKLAIGALYEGQDVTNPYMTWDRVFKYKPPHENTVDFLVKFGAFRATKEQKMIRELQLFVGYNPQQWDRITLIDYMTKQYKRTRQGYFEKRFNPEHFVGENPSSAFVDMDKNKSIFCVNGDEILENSIVEFAYIENAWKPMRVRQDKTELYKMQGISRTANDMKTAISIWKNIKEPITYEMITGQVLVDTMEDNDDAYYYRSIARDKMATKSMLDFHNYWIKKKCLLDTYKGESIFDIACGKAGDLNKWVDAGFKKVIGIDYARDNIENPIDGAYARTIKKNSGINAIYLTLDARKALDMQYFDSISDKNEQLIANIIWGFKNTATNDKHLKPYESFMPKEGCDIVSCQFAMHYFFESQETIKNFIDNVYSNLKPGGYFIGTCLDGIKVLEEMKKQNTDELIGRKDGRVIWRIKKINDKEIEVYMESIGRKFKEYIVDMGVVYDEFAKHAMFPKKTLSFETEWNTIIANKDSLKSPIIDSIMQMSDVEKQYSFLNVYFVFQKLYN